MTSTGATTFVSVRGEAQRTTEPDQARMFATLRAIADSKRAAVADVRAALAEVCGDLESLGGEVLTAETNRSALTWSAQSMRSNEEHSHDKMTGAHGPTGRHHCSVELLITVRDFSLLEAVSTALSRHDSLDVHSVSWSVDEDNAQWALVRADAINAAQVKGRDYAAALGGIVTGVDHVADAGLLGGDGSASIAFRASAGSPANLGGGGTDTSIDPVPQVLRAIIEARFTAVIGDVPGQ